MEAPTAESVLGDFNDVEFQYFGRATRFHKDGNTYRVTTENHEGRTETFTVAYTLGYRPLQQYLVDVGGGRIQALPFAWDTRDKKDGGQRWFHLYPKENVTPGNPLFWTRPLQNWNHMCGDCHTTGFVKGYSGETNTFASTWNETGNGCESCHGAGSAHIEARKRADGNTASSSMSPMRTPREQIDQCGACHARRVRLREPAPHERMRETMLETWRPQLPQDGPYFVDGQIRDEVFEIGSFLQSKMAAKGILCTDCHNPHTARLKAEGNALCSQCHKPETFDTPKHHFHEAGTPGAQCVSCHMPSRTYMVVDPRRDHRLAIPRPDLSDTLGTPNPCAGCHSDRTNAWATKAILSAARGRKGPAAAETPTWAMAAWQAVNEQRTAAEILQHFLATPPAANAPPIAHATILASLRTLTPESLGIIRQQFTSNEPLQKLGAMQAIGALPLPERLPMLIDLAGDPSLAVRMQAASLLAGADRTTLSAAQQKNLDAAIAEYRNALTRDADRAETMAALAELQLAEGDAASAAASFKKAIERDETSLAALLNYADFHRAQNNDAAAEPLLVRASTLYPDSAAAHFALGLLRVRQKRAPEAVAELARATQISPENSRYAFVHAVGLYSTGEKKAGLSALRKAQNRFPANLEIRSALEAYCADPENAGECGRN
jgi:predicted CXXCH cytochrome family protein